MRTDIPPALLAHFRLEAQSTSLLWLIEKADGTEVRGCDHDEDLTIPSGVGAGTYLAGSNITGSQMRQSSDFAVDNMEVQGAMPVGDTRTLDVNARDVEGGLFSNAPVSLYLCNWARPQDGAYVVKRGYLGDIANDSDGRYTTEIRGITQLLQQNFVRTYSERCQVRSFGDAECTVDVGALEQAGEITAVTSRRRFDATIAGGNPAGYFSLGELEFTSGENAGFTREVRRDDEGDVAGHVSTWDQFPSVVQVGDTFTIRPGCDRRASTCSDKYSNLLNFRGHGIYIVGLDALQRGPN